MSKLAAGLVIAGALVDGILADLAEVGGLEAVDARLVARRIVKAAEKRGDEAAQRALACLARLVVAVETVAALAHEGMVRVREDLRL
jgi:hypothetical protein